MLTHIRYIALTAFRDSLFLGLLFALFAAIIISYSLGNTAMVETEAMTATYSAASARVILMIGLIVFVSFHVRHAFDQKEIDVLVSRPLSRFDVVIAYFLGFAFVAFLLVLATVALLSFLPLVDLDGFFRWSIVLLMESWMVVAITLFAAFALRSGVSAVLAAMAIYVLGRMMGFFLATTDTGLLFHIWWLNDALEWLMKIIAVIIPRLDLFSKSDWLVYGVLQTDEPRLAIIQSLIYIPLLLVATTVDFLRKEF